MRIWFILVILVFLFSCGGVSKETKEMEYNKWREAEKTCSDTIPLVGPTAFTDYMRCSTNALVTLYRNIKYPYMDLIEFVQSYSIAVAQRVDNGEITDGEAVTSIKQVIFQVKEAARNRDFQSYQARMNWIQLWVSTFNNNYDQNIQCIKMGEIISCN